MIKKYKYGRDCTISLLKGVHTLFRSVSSTFGPLGSVVYLPTDQGFLHPTKDGVTVAKSIVVADQFEEIGAQSVKEVALKTVDRVGDGTTSSIIFIYSFLLSAHGVNIHELNDINDWDEIEAQLKSSKSILTKEDIKRIDELRQTVVDLLNGIKLSVSDNIEALSAVARTSSNGDEKIVELIKSCLEKIGVDATFIIENSNNTDTTVDSTEGVYLPVGMTSPFYATVPGKILCELDNPHIILTDSEIVSWNEIKHIVLSILNGDEHKQNYNPVDGTKEKRAKKTRPFVIICRDISFVAEGGLVTNIKQTGELFRTCCISLKSLLSGNHYGESDLFEDLSTVFGGRLISKNQGLELGPLSGKNSAKIKDLGACKRILVSKHKTIIFPSDERKELIVNYRNKISDLAENTQNVDEKKYHKERVKRISNGVAIVTVGANTQQSAIEMKDRLEDAVCAISAARENGVLPGACAAYRYLQNHPKFNSEDSTDPLFKFLKAAFAQMTRSLTKRGDDEGRTSQYKTLSDDIKTWEGDDLHQGEIVNLWENGILDSADSIIETISNGLELASLLLRTETLIVPDLEEMLRLRNLSQMLGGHQ